MVTLVAHFHVRDYDAWKQVFDQEEGFRRGHGVIEYRIYRDIHDRNRVVVHNDLPSEAAARAFSADPVLRAAMDRAGVEGEPGFGFLERAERRRYAETEVA
jgi:quinol monooxygenase YgiN